MKANGWLRLGSLLLWAALGSWAVPASAQSLQVTSANPNNAPQGSTNLIVKIGGSGFKNKGNSAAFYVTGSTTDTGGITVNSTSFVSSSEVDANITVSSTATLSGFDIYVTSGGRTGKGTDLFTVTSNGANSCTDVSLEAIMAPGLPSGGTALLYGDSDFGTGPNTYYNANDPLFNGGSIYTDGVDGASVKFQVCNSTNDFIMNLGTGSKNRHINFNFSQQLTAPSPGTVDVTGTIHQEGFINANEIANSSLYVNGQLVTCMGTSLSTIIKGDTSHVFFRNPAQYQTAPGGTIGCDDGTLSQLANQGLDSATVQVSHPNTCTWILEPVADANGDYVGGLVEQLKNQSFASGGQYNMPWAIKLIQLGCQ
jgi:hypothetical protein